MRYKIHLITLCIGIGALIGADFIFEPKFDQLIHTNLALYAFPLILAIAPHFKGKNKLQFITTLAILLFSFFYLAIFLLTVNQLPFFIRFPEFQLFIFFVLLQVVLCYTSITLLRQN